MKLEVEEVEEEVEKPFRRGDPNSCCSCWDCCCGGCWYCCCWGGCCCCWKFLDLDVKLDIFPKDVSENGEDPSVKFEKFDMSVNPDLPDSVEPIESVDICVMRECPRPIRLRKSSNPCRKFGGGG